MSAVDPEVCVISVVSKKAQNLILIPNIYDITLHLFQICMCFLHSARSRSVFPMLERTQISLREQKVVGTDKSFN